MPLKMRISTGGRVGVGADGLSIQAGAPALRNAHKARANLRSIFCPSELPFPALASISSECGEEEGEILPESAKR